MTITKATYVFLSLVCMAMAAVIINNNLLNKADRDRELELDLKLQNIDMEIDNRRQEIMQNYNRRANEFRNDGYQQSVRLDQERRAAWEEYQAEVRDMDNRSYWYNYNSWREDREKARSSYEYRLKRIDERSRPHETLGWTLNSLNKQMQNDLDKLEQLRQYQIANAIAESKSGTKADGSSSNPQTPAASGANAVTAIVMSEKPSAFVGGKVVHEGDKLGDVAIINIAKDAVTFEKNGKQWTQKSGDPPAKYWGK